MFVLFMDFHLGIDTSMEVFKIRFKSDKDFYLRKLFFVLGECFVFPLSSPI